MSVLVILIPSRAYAALLLLMNSVYVGAASAIVGGAPGLYYLLILCGFGIALTFILGAQVGSYLNDYPSSKYSLAIHVIQAILHSIVDVCSLLLVLVSMLWQGM